MEGADTIGKLGRTGDFRDGVLKVNVPRNDLKVKVAGTSLPTPFGFGGWVAMSRGNGGKDVMMGDLVLLQEEVNPVMSALLDRGLEVTALHNHFFFEEPRVFYMHIHGHGKALELARLVKPALDLIGHVTASGSATPNGPASPSPPQPALDTEKLASITGHKGEQMGEVYKVTVGRDEIGLKEAGAKLNARMGVNTWAAFAGRTTARPSPETWRCSTAR